LPEEVYFKERNMVRQGRAPRWLFFLILLILTGIIGLAVTLWGPTLVGWLSPPAVSGFTVEPLHLEADAEQASIRGHLECSGRTPLSEMRIVAYVTGVSPAEEGRWRRSNVPCVTQMGEQWALSPECTAFPREYSEFSVVAILVKEDVAADLPPELIARDVEELAERLGRHVYPACDDSAVCGSISPVCRVNRLPPAVAARSTQTPTAPAFAPTPSGGSTPTRVPTFTPVPASPTPSLSPTPSPAPAVAPVPGNTTPPPRSQPWNPLTPVPTAPPDYDPRAACVVRPCAPAPQLDGPQDGVEVAFGSTVELKWRWAYCLPAGWKFAVRISDVYPPHSYRYEDNPVLISCQDGKAIGRYPVGREFTTRPGTYYWNIAVVRSVAAGWERLSEQSEIRSLTVKPSDGGEGPDRP
jgi:hypothetical protein